MKRAAWRTRAAVLRACAARGRASRVRCGALLRAVVPGPLRRGLFAHAAACAWRLGARGAPAGDGGARWCAPACAWRRAVSPPAASRCAVFRSEHSARGGARRCARRGCCAWGRGACGWRAAPPPPHHDNLGHGLARPCLASPAHAFRCRCPVFPPPPPPSHPPPRDGPGRACTAVPGKDVLASPAHVPPSCAPPPLPAQPPIRPLSHAAAICWWLCCAQSVRLRLLRCACACACASVWGALAAGVLRCARWTHARTHGQEEQGTRRVWRGCTDGWKEDTCSGGGGRGGVGWCWEGGGGFGAEAVTAVGG
jgi:hypothetical protein